MPARSLITGDHPPPMPTERPPNTSRPEAPIPASPFVSVIVPARNAAGTLPALLDRLAEQTAPRESYEVVVVDDWSTDDTADRVAASGVARLVRRPAQAGVAGARNGGIDASRGDILAFTDADCLPDRAWIEQGVAALEASGAELLGGRIAVDLGARASIPALVDATHYYAQERYVSEGHAATGNLWVRRGVIERVGAFDPRYSSAEDTEFTHRAVTAGFRLGYAPDVVVTHPALPNALALVRRAFRDGVWAARRGQSHISARLRRGSYVKGSEASQQLELEGGRPGAVARLYMGIVRNACIRVPLLAGNLVGMAAARMPRPRLRRS